MESSLYAVPRTENEPLVKAEAMYNYCKKLNKKPKDLTDKELNYFLDKDSFKSSVK